MTENTHVVAICGSQADDSVTRVAAERTLDAARSAGATTDLLDLRQWDLPTFDPDRPDAGEASAVRRRVREADAVLLATPMYHGSYSSPLKTALDYCGFDEFADTTVGLLAVSGGGFPLPALEHLRTVCRALEAWTLPTQVAVPDSHSAVTDDGAFADDGVAERVDALGQELVAYANVATYPDCPSTPAPAAGD
ncbi:NADPH-dependent FMN reductase [Halorientalis regularis]|jgi:NAD(P)H-dependent FMN reductase|uniref:NAD(P)H-dependent FMN reductase n=1 Tax=Halorientalis regularis TaxID=660518 RepID=A0A1G7H049_9EURY|nr:NADPH-dependent FMN reductase [Halorientalis regularis]SDE93767.1 NAD(P)H-dependent FMN reductase [Halorientalis regularis]